MRLPPYLMKAVQAEIDQVDRRSLNQAVAQLSQRYMAGDFSSPAISTDAQRAAYLAVRLPATHAVNRRVFAEIKLRAPETKITRMLDLGAGPGTALFAAQEEFPELQQATMVEGDQRWIALGKYLTGSSPLSPSLQTEWLRHDLRSGFAGGNHDLVVASFLLGELPSSAAESVILRAWACAQKFLVLIEPGTPKRFASLNAARSLLIGHGAQILAPCPHQKGCPMAAAGDWCHFAQRLERTSQHRQLKGGALGYEDEKFSYLITTRQPSAGVSDDARILRHPLRHSGHVQLELCMPDGSMQRKTVTRSAKPAYKLARQVDWGDVWPESQ
jgi:ribosomal protein RSM22 (predicted rRNA methylase)